MTTWQDLDREAHEYRHRARKAYEAGDVNEVTMLSGLCVAANASSMAAFAREAIYSQMPSATAEAIEVGAPLPAEPLRLIQACDDGAIRQDFEDDYTYWHSAGKPTNVSAAIRTLERAGLVERPAEQPLWRPTSRGRETLDRGSV